MSYREVLGPVHAFEWLTATRRWQMYAGRSLFVGLLLLGLGFYWIAHEPRTDGNTIKGQAAIGRGLHSTLVSISLLMVLLAAPAATAGAICLDKARGTLLHVLVTDLSDSEIVLGKLAARLVPVLGLLGSSLPVLALLTLLGGVDPQVLIGSFLVVLTLAVLGCTLALTLSVWGKKTHEVLLATYLIWVIWIVIVPFGCFLSITNPPPWVIRTNPVVLTIAEYDPSDPYSPTFGTQVLFSAAALVVSAALLALTVVRIRPVIIGQWGRAGRQRKRTILERVARVRVFGRVGDGFGPTLDGNPVLWHEWHRRRPSGWAAVIWSVYSILAVSSSALAIAFARSQTRGWSEAVPVMVTVLQVVIGLLLVSVISATGLAEERVRGSLDVLLATPLSTGAIVWGKWWGAYRGVIWLALPPTAIAAVLPFDLGRWAGPSLVLLLVLGYGAALNSLGLLLATRIPQVGRVLGLCVAAFVGVTVGPIVLVITFFPRTSAAEKVALWTVMASPPCGVGFLTTAIEETQADLWPTAGFAALFWALEYATAAGVLLFMNLLIFDRCLGRIPDRWAPRRLAPARKTRQRMPAAVILEDSA